MEKTEESAIPLIAYAFLEKANTYKVLNKSTTKYCNDYEANAKDDAIKDEIEVNRQHQKVFYLASYHEDCAEDHKNYQGKIYVDEKWPSIVKDENIIKYIKRNNFKTIQWVTSEPVWFITRPNCRHYFTALDNKEVVKYTTPQLLVKHKMSTKIGDRQYLQTLGNRKDRKALGEKRNAELVIEKYKERLKLHQDLANISKNDLLMKAIAKDKFLINKWTKYLKELNGGK